MIITVIKNGKKEIFDGNKFIKYYIADSLENKHELSDNEHLYSIVGVTTNKTPFAILESQNLEGLTCIFNSLIKCLLDGNGHFMAYVKDYS